VYIFAHQPKIIDLLNLRPHFTKINYEKKELIAPSSKELNDAIVAVLLLLEKVMVAGNYANRSVIAYAREVRFFGSITPK
jgi:hypothetical protein